MSRIRKLLPCPDCDGQIEHQVTTNDFLGYRCRKCHTAFRVYGIQWKRCIVVCKSIDYKESPYDRLPINTGCSS